ncbi:hypothetical protein B0A48_07875 [Cryoendolithus antarcticus]|uniref:PH domain-containing protein n=1 Tax=Cryoendolithus antarcticus TaxID=1507870 RepID=A0A1V8T0W0_9PEZI|nr:hypothetical protein B0A48_07875 [Cryoendolithus antarcticus]
MSDTTHTTPATAAPLEKLENTVEPTSATSHVPEPSSTSTTSPAVPETSATTETAPTTSASDAVKHEDTVLGGAADGALPQVPNTTTAATDSKAVEPVSEGHLGYKAPGLLKQFLFSQKEFWLSDAPLTPQHLHLYLRGEKSEVAHPVAAWATHTGKGLLFFNKKGESERSHPAGILPLYEATDLKKSTPHEFSFEIHGHKHQFKATSDAERDGWYLAIEKEVELAKASKESVRGSEGYKSEMEKLNAPNVIGGVAGANKSSALPKKSTEVTEPRRTGSSESEGEGLKKKNKSRSTSRGVLNRLKGKKEEADTKKEIKKEEEEEAKEEKKMEKEEKKIEKEEAKAEKHGEHGSALPFIGGTSAPLDAPSAADRAVGAPLAEIKHEEPVNALPATNGATPTKIDERTKPTKRNSIFGKLPGAFGGLMSPSKEKSEREAELKPAVPPKDHSVSETAPQLPETTATEPIESVAPTTTATTEPIKPEIHEPAPVTEPTTKATDAVTPGKEKKSFLSGLPFLGKRDRSVSPSPALKDTPAKTETSTVPATEESTPVEPVKAAEPVTETPATLPETAHNNTFASPIEPMTESKAIDPVHETTPTDTTSPAGANKRNSVFGNLGRRASKALNRMQSTPNSKKENAIPGATESTPKTTTTAADETLPTTTTADKATESSLTDPVTENKPETVGTSSHTPVTASA